MRLTTVCCSVLNNASWWDEVNGVSFASDIARHFRISAMLNKERYVKPNIRKRMTISRRLHILLFVFSNLRSPVQFRLISRLKHTLHGSFHCFLFHTHSVKQRLQSDEGMNCSEFLYPIFQAYDFLQLYRRHNCRMQASPNALPFTCC